MSTLTVGSRWAYRKREIGGCSRRERREEGEQAEGAQEEGKGRQEQEEQQGQVAQEEAQELNRSFPTAIAVPNDRLQVAFFLMGADESTQVWCDEGEVDVVDEVD